MHANPESPNRAPAAVKRPTHERHANLRLTQAFVALCTLPLMVYFVFATWIEPISPYYANYDPEFQYLMNSLEAFKGKSYTYVEHPGTPLEVIGSGIYVVTYPLVGKSPDDFVLYHLRNPRLFLTLAHAFLLLASIACIWRLSSVLTSEGNLEHALLAGSISVLYFAAHPLSFTALTVWSHNSLSFAFGTLFIVMLFESVVRRPPGDLVPLRQLIMFGLYAGVLTAVTIYLAAWIAGTLTIVIVFYRLQRISWRKTMAAALTIGASSLAGFSLAVLPGISQMLLFFRWVRALLTHESTYLLGSGDEPLLVRWAGNFVDLGRQLPMLFIATSVLLLLAAIAFVRWRNRAREKPGLWAFIFGTILQVGLLTALILDHPKAEYLLSVGAVLPVLAISILRIWEYDHALGRILTRTVTILVLGGFVFSFGQAISQHQMEVARIAKIERQTAQSREAYAQLLGTKSADLFVLWTYRSYAPCFSLWFGNDSTGRVFRKEISQLCYRQSELNIWTEKVNSGQGVSALEDTKWDMIIGCEDGFKIPVLANQPNTETFPILKLECGSLKIAYNRN